MEQCWKELYRSAREERCRVEEKCCRLQECSVNCGEVLYKVLKLSWGRVFRKSVGEAKRSLGKGCRSRVSRGVLNRRRVMRNSVPTNFC